MAGMAKRTRAAGFAVMVVGLGAAVGNDAVVPDAIDVSLFTIAKSENKNEVQYVVRVDDRCAPSAGGSYLGLLAHAGARTDRYRAAAEA
jgi:hypothetical protein